MGSRPVSGGVPSVHTAEEPRQAGLCDPLIDCLRGLFGGGDRIEHVAAPSTTALESVTVATQPGPEAPQCVPKTKKSKKLKQADVPPEPSKATNEKKTPDPIFTPEDFHMPLERQRSVSAPPTAHADEALAPAMGNGFSISLPDLNVLRGSSPPAGGSVLAFMKDVCAGPVSIQNINDVLRNANDNIASDLDSRILLNALPAYVGKALASLSSPPTLDEVTEILFCLSRLRVDCLDEVSGSALRAVVQQVLGAVSIDSSTSPRTLNTLQRLASAVANLNLVDLNNVLPARDEVLLTTFRGIMTDVFCEAQSRRSGSFSIQTASDLHLARVVVAWLDEDSKESRQACAALKGFHDTEWHLTNPSAAALAGVADQPHEVLMRTLLAELQGERQKAGHFEKVSREAPRPCAGYTPDALFVVSPEIIRIKKKLVKIPERTLYIEWDSKRYHAMPSALNGTVPGEVIRDRVLARVTGVAVLHISQDIWNQATGEASTIAKNALRFSPGTVRRFPPDLERERTMKHAALCMTIKPMLETLLDTHLDLEGKKQ